MAKRGGPADGKPFRKGVSGNPGGRPKSSLASALAAEGERKVDGKTNAQALAELAWKKANAGELAWANWLGDRILGKAPVSLEGADGAPIRFTLALGHGDEA